ncbi:MAG: hypothetical protein JWQ38_989 [Flavipsychrobacter sp.]|nr:hypothetical protein [Flavipsychrobacter sp.]
MISNKLDSEIKKYFALLKSGDKETILNIMRGFLQSKKQNAFPKIDYTKYRFPISAIKINRNEI